MPLCFHCRDTFTGHEAYQRHWWRVHGGDLDHGDAITDVHQLDSLKPEAAYPDPPTLDG